MSARPDQSATRRYAIDAGDGIEVHACITGGLKPEVRDALIAVGRAAFACVCGNGEAEEDRGAVLRCPVHGPQLCTGDCAERYRPDPILEGIARSMPEDWPESAAPRDERTA